MKHLKKYLLYLPFVLVLNMGFAQETFYNDNFTFDDGWSKEYSNPINGDYTFWHIGNNCPIDDESMSISNYYSGTALFNCGYKWDGNNNLNGIKACRNINASGFNNLKMVFDWKCYGEWYNGWGGSVLYDYGEVGYSLDNGATYTWFTQGGVDETGKYYNQLDVKRNDTIVLPDTLNSTSFVLAFKWIHDNSVGGDPGFIIDNLRIMGDSEYQVLKDTIFEENFSIVDGIKGWILETSVLQGSTNTKNGWTTEDECTLNGSNALSVNVLDETETIQSCGYIHNLDIRPNGIVAYKTIDAYGYKDLELSFDWLCNGENWETTIYDYGQVGYSVDGGYSFTWFATGGKNNSGKYYGQLTPIYSEKIALPSHLKNKTFQIGFRWISDYSIGYYPGFVVDNIVVEGAPAPNPKKVMVLENFENTSGWNLEEGPKDVSSQYCLWKIDRYCGINGNSLNIVQPDQLQEIYKCGYPSVNHGGILATKAVDATNLKSLSLQFDWKCDGERWSTTYYDYGQVGYSVDNGVTYTWLDYGGYNNTGKYTDQSTVWKDYYLDLPQLLDNKKFLLAFKWKNDYSIEGQYGFMIDNLKVLATGKGVRERAVLEIPKINRMRVENVTLDGLKDELQLDLLAGYENIKITENNYIDGLGRPIQKVVERGSVDHLDLIYPTVYTAAGTIEKNYLPIENNADDGKIELEFLDEIDAFYDGSVPGIPQSNFPFSEVRYERSSNKALKIKGAPGRHWQIDLYGKVVRYYNDFNKPYENLHKFWFDESSGTIEYQGTYIANTVKREKSVDENRSHHLVFTNSLGQKILDLRIDSVADKFFRTYYVYDEQSRLRVVLPPKASEYFEANPNILSSAFLDSLAFQYNYDERGRVVEKKVPGSGWVYLAYDLWDRLAATQDATQRAQPMPEFTFYKYDAYNRVIMTGEYYHSTGYTIEDARNDLLIGTYSHHENLINGVYTTWFNWPAFGSEGEHFINAYYFFDHYNYYAFSSMYFVPELNYLAEDVSNCTNGKPTGKKLRILGTNNFLESVNYYNSKGRIIQTLEKNLSQAYNRTTLEYDFVGNVINKLETYDFIPENTNLVKTNTIKTEYTHDHMLRLKEVAHKINNNPKIITVINKYTKLGNLLEKGLHTEDFGTTFLQINNYQYNIRGWLTSINDPYNIEATGESDLFALELKYQPDVPSTSWKNEYGGNISEMSWVVKNTATNQAHLRRYEFKYDYVNRLSDAYYKNITAPSLNLQYNVSYHYDLNGNLTTVSRSGNYNSGFGLVDNLKYAYKGNRLQYVNDQVFNSAGIGDFKDNHTGTLTNPDYLYDLMGNTMVDKNKGINSIEYNHLQLPEQVSYNALDYIGFLYDAEGRKVQKILSYNGSLTKTTYLGALQYLGADLEFISHEAGRCIPNGSNFTYQYNLTDHLGNVRAVVEKDNNGNPRLAQENHYYPYGGLYNGASTYVLGQNNYYLYNNKELQTEFGLNWYDYGARFYDPQLGRWHVVDPLAEKRISLSPYNYVQNNPLIRIDPTGALDNPIYDKETSEFLGTDSKGLEGEAIIMDKADFIQGMSHEDAMKKGHTLDNMPMDQVIEFANNGNFENFLNHYNNLPNRMDYSSDFVLTKEIADKHWQGGTGEELFVNSANIDLPGVTTKDFNSKGYYSKNFIWGMSNTGKVFGTLDMTLLNPKTGTVKLGYRNPNVSPNGLVMDRYDFTYDGRKMRDFATWVGKPSGTGKAFDIHGYGVSTVPVKK